MYAVQYPGREDRIAEECMSNMADLAPAVATALSPLTDRPFALFGHSMGAAVAYEVARLLRPEPVCLFVSGRHSPLEQVGNDVRLRDDAGVLAELARLGGTPTELLGDPELYEMVVPTMRSDFTIEETYQRHEGRRLDCPIVALVGTEDPDVTAAQATRWKELTSGPFRLETYPGDHFYLVPQHRRVIETVTTELARLAP
jgi:surfactin synthase thioesterase subunit